MKLSIVTLAEAVFTGKTSIRFEKNQQPEVASGCLQALHNRCAVLTMACLAKTMDAVEQLTVMIRMIDKLHSYLLAVQCLYQGWATTRPFELFPSF